MVANLQGTEGYNHQTRGYTTLARSHLMQQSILDSSVLEILVDNRTQFTVVGIDVNVYDPIQHRILQVYAMAVPASN